MAENKSVYILSLEASDIYNHIHRGAGIKYNYCGMIPYSLELVKLKQEGLKVKYIKSRDKEISNDIINVKFKQKVKSGNELKKILKQKKIDSENNQAYIDKIDEFIGLIENAKNEDDWKEASVDNLRKDLYTNGFKIKQVNKKTGEIKEIEYVVYKRSSSKSRTGQCLFIKKSLYNKMIKWSRMNLPFKKNMRLDLAGLLAYESLVGSSLESVVEINPKNILIVDDVDSKFRQICNVVRKGEEGYLDSFTEETMVSNSLFDGESLLEATYFEDGVSMKLLRNHMFKSAAFNCNIQKFLKNHCPENVYYDNWQIFNMYNEPMYAKDVKLIITPSSLKALKFSNTIGEEKDMWNYWKQKVEEDGNTFGVCKHDKESKLGKDENGVVLQQTSYQMINCLPIKRVDMEQLTKTEKNYIERLKNDDDFFIEKVKESANVVNSNEMLCSLYSQNQEIVNTELFRNFRKGFIKNHINHSKKGKIKLNGDYCVLLGNPVEFLHHSIGQFDVNAPKLSLKDNEVYTTLFEFNKELVGFRNPNTSPSNVLIVNNKHNEEIETYFNLTSNVVCVNAINFAFQDILSGCDYDSDTVLLFDNEKMLELGKQCFGKYYVCINNVEGQKRKYRLNKHDMYEIDNQLATSQRNIGKVVNLGQFCMSVYWDLINNSEFGVHVNELLKKVDVMTILSGIAIDMAKKFYEIDIDKEINNVLKNEKLKERKNKPNFWQYVSQSKTIGKRVEFYDCPMDYLIKSLEKNENAERKGNINFDEFIYKQNEKEVDKRQLNKIMNLVKETDDLIKRENAVNSDQEEKNAVIRDVLKELNNKIKKVKINADTMYAIIKTAYDIDSKIMMRLLKILYETHTTIFLKTFKNGDFEEKLQKKIP